MDKLPELRVDSVRKVFDDGNHNAFTSLCRFRGEMYLAFRSCPDGHQVFDTSRVVVLRSGDGGAWEQVHTFAVRFRDTRDPHLLVFRDTLFVYTGTSLCDPETPGEHDLNDQLGHAVWTRDGEAWEGPVSLEGTYGHFVWGAATFGGKASLSARRVRDFEPTGGANAQRIVRQSAMLESDDGLVWKFTGLFHPTKGNETSFLFEEDGSCLALNRSKGGNSILCRAHPPYKEWTHTELNRFVAGPLLVKWGERYLVGGRKLLAPGEARMSLAWLADDRLVEAAELPSGGDTSYPGFLALSEERALVSYYSSHEGSGGKEAPAAIYLAEISLA